MLMLNFDFYDIHAVLTAFRSAPLYEHNAAIAEKLKNLIESPQTENSLTPNTIRHALAEIEDIDREYYYWVFTENIYTYGHKIIKDEAAYQIMSACLAELLTCLENKNYDRFKDLTDALHNVPIILTSDAKQTRKQIKAEISCYRKNWNSSFLKDIVN